MARHHAAVSTQRRLQPLSALSTNPTGKTFRPSGSEHKLAQDPIFQNLRTGHNLIDFLSHKQNLGGPPPNQEAVVSAIIMGGADAAPDARSVRADGSVDRGLFQINSRQHPEVSDACAYNPYCALRAAKAITRNWSDYSGLIGYSNGSYKNFLGANSPLRQSGAVGAGINVPNPITDVANAIGAAFGWLGQASNWLRIGEAIAAVVLLAIALRALLQGQLGSA